jgi:hypothetical protein
VKKLIGLLLSLAMVVTLSLGNTGCGGKDKKDAPKDKTDTGAKDTPAKDTPPKDTPPKDTPPKDKKEKKDMP